MIFLFRIKNYIRLIFLFLFVLSCTKSNENAILLRKKIDSFHSNYSVNFFMSTDNSFIAITTESYRRSIDTYEKTKGALVGSLDLYEIGLKDLKLFYPLNDHSFIAASMGRTVSGNYIPSQLIKLGYDGVIHFKEALPFTPQAIAIKDSLIYIAGNFQGKFFHQFDLSGNLQKSFYTLNDDERKLYHWKLASCCEKDTVFFASADKYKIWIIKDDQLVRNFKYRDESNLIKTEQQGEREKIYRQKGIHDMIYHKGKLFISCFDHSNNKSKFWYDVVDVNRGSLIEIISTDFLYSFIRDMNGNNKYVYHNLPEFELYEIKFK